jgi:hypothetical protein
MFSEGSKFFGCYFYQLNSSQIELSQDMLHDFQRRNLQLYNKSFPLISSIKLREFYHYQEQQLSIPYSI